LFLGLSDCDRDACLSSFWVDFILYFFLVYIKNLCNS
jgi:hypothetical protein